LKFEDLSLGPVVVAAVGSQLVLMFVDSREDLTRAVLLEGGHVDGAPHRADPLPKALWLLCVPVVFGGQAGIVRRGGWTGEDIRPRSHVLPVPMMVRESG
jgi:hypothetical protein